MAQCLDSVLSQDYQDFEILLIDDASSDRSREICDNYAKRDSRIKYFQHETNLGQQATIKDGVMQARGRWISFVDADDSLPADALSTLHSLCDDNTDIIVGFSWQGDNTVRQMPIEQWRLQMLRSDPILCTRWAKLYRSSVLDEDTMSGIPSIKLGEDMIQNIKAAFRTQKHVTIIYKQVYCYNRNEDSYSAGYKWTVDKTSVLYDAIRDTLPVQADIKCHQAVVANGLGMIEKLVLKGGKQERARLSGASLMSALRKDAGLYGFHLKKHEWLLLHHPSSPLTRGLLFVRKAFHIICRYFI